MIICLDANIVIYLVEGNPVWEPKASARVKALAAAGDEIAVSDAVRLECLVGPYASGDLKVLAAYQTFFGSPALRFLGCTAGVWERGARIRASHGFEALDALHLATAVEYGCGLFLTGDSQLARFPDIPVEVLK
jgi:predicted nucleic acid-binding protein